MHQQDAYVAEKGEIGSFELIGYDSPASNVFGYTEAYTAKTKEIWQAKPKTGALSECSDVTWAITSTLTSASKGKHGANDLCPKLTPNFSTIGAGT